MEALNWPILMVSFSFVAGFVIASIALYLSFHWKNMGARSLMLFMIFGAIWSFVYGMEFLWQDQATKLWFVKIEYASSIWLGLFFLSFVLSITKSRYQLNTAGYLLLGIFPVLFIFLVFSNDFHHLMWKQAWLEYYYGVAVLDFLRGPGYWATQIFVYGPVLLAIIILIRSLAAAQGILKKQLTAVLVGAFFPCFLGLMRAFDLGIFKLIDLTPASFVISGGVFTWALLRYQMLNLIPLAHQTIIESMSDPVIVVDKKDRILAVNRAGKTLFKMEAFFPGGTAFKEALPQLYERVIQPRRFHPVETEISFKIERTLKHWNLSLSPLLGRNNKQKGWLIVLRDITAQKIAQEALKESGRVHRMMLEALPNPIVFYNVKGETTYVNPPFTRVFGWELHDVLGKKIDFVPKENQAETQKAIKETFDQPEGNYSFISRRYTKSRDILDVNINSTSYPTRGDNPGSIVVNYTDITQIKKAERELRNSQDFIKNIINSMPSIIIGLDSQGIVTQWNVEARNLTGVDAEKAEGKYLEDVFPQLSGYMPMVKQAIDKRKVKKEEKLTIKAGKTTILADIIIYPILAGSLQGAVIRVDDVSERARIEEIMVQSEKMLSVGGLAAGMAHEINNPLAGMLQNARVIRDRLTKNLPANLRAAESCGISLENLKTYLEARDIFFMMDLIEASGRQAAQIVSNMLSFSRKSQHRKSIHYLHDIMDATIEMVSSDYNTEKNYDFRSIEIVREYHADVPPLSCRKSEIQQVFLNILKNGAEAMAEAGVSSPRYVIRSIWGNDQVIIEIEDNGPGIDREIKRRIFEPFFTTKDVGEGTGLGLSVSYFIITKNHDGALGVESIKGKGTRFIIKLPLTLSEKSL